MIGDDHPRRIAGAALLGAPNGVWLGIPLGLFVPWDGKATGTLAQALPHPVDELLRMHTNEPVTLGRLAELDDRIWLLAFATLLMTVLAGVLTAVRTPAVTGGPGSRPMGAAGFAGRCALRLGVVMALGLPLLVRLTDVSADASLSVLGFDAFGAGIELHGHLGMALLLGAAWGAGAGAVGALLAHGAGAAGRRAAPAALSGGGVEPEERWARATRDGGRRGPARRARPAPGGGAVSAEHSVPGVAGRDEPVSEAAGWPTNGRAIGSAGNSQDRPQIRNRPDSRNWPNDRGSVGNRPGIGRAIGRMICRTICTGRRRWWGRSGHRCRRVREGGPGRVPGLRVRQGRMARAATASSPTATAAPAVTVTVVAGRGGATATAEGPARLSRVRAADGEPAGRSGRRTCPPHGPSPRAATWAG